MNWTHNKKVMSFFCPHGGFDLSFTLEIKEGFSSCTNQKGGKRQALVTWEALLPHLPHLPLFSPENCTKCFSSARDKDMFAAEQEVRANLGCCWVAARVATGALSTTCAVHIKSWALAADEISPGFDSCRLPTCLSFTNTSSNTVYLYPSLAGNPRRVGLYKCNVNSVDNIVSIETVCYATSQTGTSGAVHLTGIFPPCVM